MSAATTPSDVTTEPQTTDDATGPNGERGKDERRFTQADLDRIVEERLERAKAKAERDREQAEAAAREEALRKQEEFRELAALQADRLKELEPLTEQVETLTQERDAALAVVTALVEQELKDAPDFVRDAIADRSPVEKLKYLNQHRDKWSEGKPRGNAPTPNGKPSAPLTRDDIKNQYLKQVGRAAR